MTTAREMVDLLSKKHRGTSSYGNPQWACYTEFPTATGFYPRRIDFLAVNLTRPIIIAYEIKVSRQDFTADIANFHDKQKDAYDNSTEFWYVCASGIAKPDEVPEGCGLMEVTKTGKLRKKKAAKIRSSNIDHSFMQSLLRQKMLYIEKTGIPVMWAEKGEVTTKEIAEHCSKEIAEAVRSARTLMEKDNEWTVVRRVRRELSKELHQYLVERDALYEMYCTRNGYAQNEIQYDSWVQRVVDTAKANVVHRKLALGISDSRDAIERLIMALRSVTTTLDPANIESSNVDDIGTEQLRRLATFVLSDKEEP